MVSVSYTMSTEETKIMKAKGVSTATEIMSEDEHSTIQKEHPRNLVASGITSTSHYPYTGKEKEADDYSNGACIEEGFENQERKRNDDTPIELNTEPAVAEVLLHLAEPRVLASLESGSKAAPGTMPVHDENNDRRLKESIAAVERAQATPRVDNLIPFSCGVPMVDTSAGLGVENLVEDTARRPTTIDNVVLRNKGSHSHERTSEKKRLKTQETATQSAVAALLGFACQTQDKPGMASDETSYDDSDNDEMIEDDAESGSMDDVPDISILGPEAKELAEAWVASKTDNSKKADWEYIEGNTTGPLHEIIKEKRRKFADTFVENSLFHLREYIPKGDVKAAFLAYRNRIAKQRFGISDAYKSKPRKKIEQLIDEREGDENSISQKTPGRRRRYGEISLVVKECEYNKALEIPIMIDCHLTQELIELTKLLVAYNIVPAGRGGKIKLEHLERAGASESLIMLCNSKRTSKITETITLTNLISSKYVRDGFENFLAEATRSYNNGGPIFGPLFCNRDIEEGKLSIPIALGLKEEHKELSRLLLLGNKGNVKTTKTRSFEWKLVDWDVVVKNASHALAAKISARRKNKSFTNHAINNLVNNNAEQKAIIVYIERLRRLQLSLDTPDTFVSGEMSETNSIVSNQEPLAQNIATCENESLSIEDNQCHRPLKKRKRTITSSGSGSIQTSIGNIFTSAKLSSQEYVPNLSSERSIEKSETSMLSDAANATMVPNQLTLPTVEVSLDKPDQKDAEMLLSVGRLNDDLVALKTKRPIMENSYKDRMTGDGCYRPSRDPQKKGDGTFARPRGRGPPGMDWDPFRGLFVPGKGDQKNATDNSIATIDERVGPILPNNFIREGFGANGEAKDVSDLEGDDVNEINEKATNMCTVKHALGIKRKVATVPVQTLIPGVLCGESAMVGDPAPSEIDSSSKSRKVEQIDHTQVIGKTGLAAIDISEAEEPRVEAPFESTVSRSQVSSSNEGTYGNDALQAFLWVSSYSSRLCDYDQGAYLRRYNFSRWYEVEWKKILGDKTDGDRETFVEEQKKRLLVFKNQEDAFLEHLKSDALKIFTSDIFSSVKLAPLSVILSKLVEDFINGKILEFDAVAGVMGKSLNAYMYLMEDRELKWDDFHSLQEAKLAKYENSMMWNEHLVGCHTAIGRLL